MDAWTYQYAVHLEFIRPGKPIDHGYIESFNGRLRDECLNVESFLDLSDVREKLERWRLDCNHVRPHSALADRALEEFVRDWQQLSAAALQTAGPAKEAPAGAVLCIAAADPKPIQLSGPPLIKVRGGAEKQSTDITRQAAQKGSLLEVVN